MRHSILYALALVFVACGGPEPAEEAPESTGGSEATGPTFADDLRMICDAPVVLADRLAETTPAERSRVLAEYIAAEVATDEARELFQALATVPPAEKAAMLREAPGAPASCAMADYLEAGSQPSEGEAADERADESEPTVEPGGATGGGRDRETLARVIRRHINEVRYCYERQLVREPDLEGTLRVRFTIAADGSIAAAEVTTGMHPEVDRCVVERIQTWAFSASDGVTVVNYPFVFEHTED